MSKAAYITLVILAAGALTAAPNRPAAETRPVKFIFGQSLPGEKIRCVARACYIMLERMVSQQRLAESLQSYAPAYRADMKKSLAGRLGEISRDGRVYLPDDSRLVRYTREGAVIYLNFIKNNTAVWKAPLLPVRSTAANVTLPATDVNRPSHGIAAAAEQNEDRRLLGNLPPPGSGALLKAGSRVQMKLSAGPITVSVPVRLAESGRIGQQVTARSARGTFTVQLHDHQTALYLGSERR